MIDLTRLSSAVGVSLALVAGACAEIAPHSGGSDALRAVVNEERNVVVLHRGDKPAQELALTDYVLDGVCMAELDGQQYLFPFSDRGYLGQWVLTDTPELARLERTLPGLIEVADCAVDEAAAHIYVLEEGLGVWRYGALPGSGFDRELLAMFQPHGSLDPEHESFSMRGAELYVGDVRLAEFGRGSRRELPLVQPAVETAPVPLIGDAADDPAIWFNPEQPQQSLILGTDKRLGLRVYDLQGEQRQEILTGRINNVDVRPLADHARYVALAAASNRTLGSISLFGIDRDGQVSWLREAEISTGLDDPYGLCMYAAPNGLQVFVNDKDGRLQQWALTITSDAISAQKLREHRLHDQPEGCVADDSAQRLFVGVEDHGVYTLSAALDGAMAPTLLAAADDRHLVADVEGMDLYLDGDVGYLVVSSQGDNSYALYDRQPPHRYRGSFRVGANLRAGVDGTSETDGLAVHSGNFGPQFPRGVLIVQDGYNTLPADRQNFKVIDWRDIDALLAQP